MKKLGWGLINLMWLDFNVDFAYTMDGGPVGELQYETFNAAQAETTIQGKMCTQETAKDTMINALQLAIDFHNQLPKDQVPEKNRWCGRIFPFDGVERNRRRSKKTGVYHS